MKKIITVAILSTLAAPVFAMDLGADLSAGLNSTEKAVSSAADSTESAIKSSLTNSYFGWGVGRSIDPNFVGPTMGNGFTNNTDNTTAKLYLGKKVDQSGTVSTSLEVAYANLGQFNVGGVGAKADAYEAAAVFKDRILCSPFSAGLRLGAAYTNADYKNVNYGRVVPVYGLVGEYRFNSKINLAVNFDRYENFVGTQQNLDNVSVGLRYNF
jgi:hypothetical protein